MLELRPACENCNASLPPNSPNAMICSFECTFSRSCVENILDNVGPNCAEVFLTHLSERRTTGKAVIISARNRGYP